MQEGKVKIAKRGKFVKIGVDLDFVPLFAIIKTDPKFRKASMYYIGLFMNRELYRRFLSDSTPNGTLKYTKKYDSRDRPLVRHWIVGNNRFNQIRMTSFPLNPFEFGRTYRNPPERKHPRPKSRGEVTQPWKARKAGRDPARGILTQKFPSVLERILPPKAQSIVIEELIREGFV